MSKVTVFHINNRFFLPTGDSVREIPFAIVSAWEREGTEVEVKEVEQYV